MNIMADEEPTVASCCNYAVLPSLQQRTMPVDTARRLQASSVRVIACTGETTGFVVQLRGHKLLATTRGAVSSAKDASGCRLVFADGRAYVSRSEDVVAVRTHTQRTPWHALIQPVAWSHLHLCLCSVNVTFVRFVDKVFADVDITLELPPQSADCRTSPGCGVVHGDLEPPASSLGDDDTSTVMASPTPSTNLDTTAMQLAITLLAAPVSTADAAANSTGARGDADHSTKPHPTGLLDKAMELLDNADAGCEVRNGYASQPCPNVTRDCAVLRQLLSAASHAPSSAATAAEAATCAVQQTTVASGVAASTVARRAAPSALKGGASLEAEAAGTLVAATTATTSVGCEIADELVATANADAAQGASALGGGALSTAAHASQASNVADVGLALGMGICALQCGYEAYKYGVGQSSGGEAAKQCGKHVTSSGASIAVGASVGAVLGPVGAVGGAVAAGWLVRKMWGE